MLTDLDVLAFRFPGSGRPAVRRGRVDTGRFAPDPALGGDPDRADMLIGEVKEGPARMNASTVEMPVVEAALARFGCCDGAAAGAHARALLATGSTLLPVGHRLRLVAFGRGETAPGGRPYHVVGLGHVVRFLQEYLRSEWDVLAHAEWKDPAFGFLVTFEKALRDRTNPTSGPLAVPAALQRNADADA